MSIEGMSVASRRCGRRNTYKCISWRLTRNYHSASIPSQRRGETIRLPDHSEPTRHARGLAIDADPISAEHLVTSVSCPTSASFAYAAGRDAPRASVAPRASLSIAAFLSPSISPRPSFGNPVAMPVTSNQASSSPLVPLGWLGDALGCRVALVCWRHSSRSNAHWRETVTACTDEEGGTQHRTPRLARGKLRLRVRRATGFGYVRA